MRLGRWGRCPSLTSPGPGWGERLAATLETGMCCRLQKLSLAVETLRDEGVKAMAMALKVVASHDR